MATRGDDSRGFRASSGPAGAHSSAARDPGASSPRPRDELAKRLAELRPRSGWLGGGRSLEILTILLLGAGVLLVAADFLDLFRVKIGAAVIDEQVGGEQHAYAVLVIGTVVCAAAMLARSGEAWAPAAGAAALGGIALLIALIGDLPDATRTDLVRGGRIASADPAVGFWVELAGALLAVSSGAALAFLLHRRTVDGDRRRRAPGEDAPLRTESAGSRR